MQRDGNPKLPTRVIDVSYPDTVQFYCSRPGEVVPYSTLSYRRGDSRRPVKLEERNLADLVKGIKVSKDHLSSMRNIIELAYHYLQKFKKQETKMRLSPEALGVTSAIDPASTSVYTEYST